ncbi:GntR family transcriptional regulator [Corynebacterium glyciniphilum]|uniref:GntR family transcriptional regulator n=1 Tax=Corynebacterium glyciniphilum TaxID=1404244 RepID=UPI0011AB7303|nr:GntR family transcriptional regulator [Corynebacterium glyciniphilum]
MVRNAGNTDRRQRVVDEIRRWIISGAIAPGERLVEAQVTARLEVSRPTAREALNQLAWSGYLVQEAYRGHRVGSVDPQRVMDFAWVRYGLDVNAAKDILDDSSGLRLVRLEQALERYRRDMVSEDPVSVHEAHVRFHKGFWQSSENSFLLKLWPAVEAEMALVLAYEQRHRHDNARAVLLHERLVDTVRGGDPEAIRVEIEKHIVGSARELVGMMVDEA